MILTQLRRMRFAVLLVVLAGIGSSIAMNVFHAPSNPIARFVAALPPLAVFGCLELVVRIPSSSRWLTAVRILGATIVAGGAAVLSFAQQRAAVESIGFPEWQSWMWPWIIDGTMIVASVSLVEVTRKIRQVGEAGMTAPTPAVAARAWVDQFETPETLAFRAAQKELREQEAQRAKSLNGSKAA
jgi:hypothetical protein